MQLKHMHLHALKYVHTRQLRAFTYINARTFLRIRFNTHTIMTMHLNFTYIIGPIHLHTTNLYLLKKRMS